MRNLYYIIPIAAVVFLAGCAGNSAIETIQAASHARALERMADNLSNKASAGHCSIIKTGGQWYSQEETTTVSCP